MSRYAQRAMVVMILFAFVYGGTDAITARRALRVPLYFEAELATPFVPAFAWAYLSITLLFLIVPFALRSAAELNALAAALAAAILVAGAGFLLFPSEPAYPPHAAPVSGAAVFRAADLLNLRYNMAPSLHAALSTICAAAFAGKARIAGRIVLWGWAAAIWASALLTHQHHLIDIVAGVLLGLASWRLVYERRAGSATRPLPRPDWSEAPGSRA